MGFVAYLLFFLAGLAFGYAAPGKSKMLPFIFPVLLAIGAAVSNGIDLTLILRLIVALAVTALGIVLGALMDDRARRREAHAA